MSTCLDNDAILEWIDGSPADSQRTRAEEHIAACDGCRALVGELMRARGGARPDPVAPGSRFADRYLVERLLGRGAMGEVYAAFDSKLERRVAVKILRDIAANSTAVRARFEQESRLMARLRHPHLITVFDVDTHAGRPYVAMELVDGQTMRTWCVGRRWPEIVAAYRDVALALAEAHAAGAIHRDIKPENILVSREGRAVLTDFGLALDVRASAASDTKRRRTLRGSAVGTPAYMAPEQRAGGWVDERTDVFGLCMAMYESLWGVLHRDGDAMPRGSVPPWVHAIVVRGLATSPADRHSSARALVAALDRRRRGVRAAVAAAALVLAVVAGVGFGWTQGSSNERSPCPEPAAAATAWWHDSARAELETRDGAAPLVERLDEHLFAWERVRDDVCEAAVAGRNTPGTALQQLTCLDADLARVRAVAETIDEPDVSRVQAIAAIDALPPLHRCAGAEDVLLRNPTPDDALRPEVDALREQLSELDGRSLAGAHEDASEAVARLHERVQATAWKPIVAEYLHRRAVIESRAGRNAEARELQLQAVHVAEAGRHDALLAVASSALAVHTVQLGDNDRALEYLDRSLAALERAHGLGDDARAAALHNLGDVARATGRYPQAQELLAEAVRLRAAEPVRAAESQGALASVLMQLGRAEESIATRTAALDTLIAAHDEDHPAVLLNLTDLAGSQLNLGRHDEARPIAERAIAIADRTLPPGHPDRARLSLVLAAIEEAAGHCEAALPLLTEAREAFVAAYGSTHVGIAMALEGEASCLAELGRAAEGLAKARAAHVMARDLYGGDHLRVAILGLSVAELLLATEQPDEAAAEVTAASAMLERTVGGEHALSVRALFVQARAELARGQAAAGRDSLARVVDLCGRIAADARVCQQASAQLQG